MQYLSAAEIAKSFGIRVYTIGVGTNGMAPYPYPVGGTIQYVNVPVEIDEKTLTQIAGTTEGNYFRATSNSKLKEVYEEIDKLEKTKLNVMSDGKMQRYTRIIKTKVLICCVSLSMNIFSEVVYGQEVKPPIDLQEMILTNSRA